MIRYMKGYKYQTVCDYTVATGLTLPKSFVTRWVILSENGILTIRSGYAWDGPSGPTFDTLTFMRGSLIHDALYQLMRMGRLSQEYRGAVDRLLQRICIEDGMCQIRAWWVYQGVRFGAGPAAKLGTEHEPVEAP